MALSPPPLPPPPPPPPLLSPKRPHWTEEEEVRIQKALCQPIEYEHIQFRPSAQGSVAYVEGWKVLNLANEVFGFNGWSSEILSLTRDFEDVSGADGGRISVGYSCMVRIRLRDGTFHDDIGYGSAENQRCKGAAYEKARKEAVTDAMKRALRVFGPRLGNCAYDKAYLRSIVKGNRGGGTGLPPTTGTTLVAPAMATATASGTSGTSAPSGAYRPNPIVNLSAQMAPIDFAPTWKAARATMSGAISGGGMPGNGSSTTGAAQSAAGGAGPAPMAISEPESEPVVTEEQLLEFGSFFSEKIDYADVFHPHKPPTGRQELRTVTMSANQFKNPHHC